MADWSVPFKAHYRFVRVRRSDWKEIGTIEGVRAGGEVTRSYATSIKWSASLTCDRNLNLKSDFLRIYMDADFLGAQPQETVCLGTYLVSQPKRQVEAYGDTMEADLYGPLQILLDMQFAGTYLVPKGASAIGYATNLCRGAGLLVTADATNHKTSRDRTYGIPTEESQVTEEEIDDNDGDMTTEDSQLFCVNDLCDIANFASVTTDPYGRALLKTYHVPAMRPVTWDLKEGPNCRFLASMEDEQDLFGLANCVKVVVSNSDKCIIGTARNDDPNSPWSTRAVGREIWRNVRKTEDMTQQQANDYAKRLLKTSGNARRKITFQHTYLPMEPGQIMKMTYPSGGIEDVFQITKVTYDLGAPGCLMTVSAKTFNKEATDER